jgi:predicted transcriptional regulator
MRKEEHKKRPDVIKNAHKRLEELEDEAKDLTEKKPWINKTHIDEVLKITEEIKTWLEESNTKQAAQALSEDPVFRVGELDAKLTRANAVFTRISSIPKPKEKKANKKAKNIKMENVTIDGNEGDWEDFVKIENGEEETKGEQQ